MLKSNVETDGAEQRGSVAASVGTSDEAAKTVLVVDYFFPPLAGAAVLRTLGFVRYLAYFGWKPIVLSVHSGDSNFYDSSLLEWIPKSVDVQRAASIEPLRFAKRLFTRASAEGNRHGSELRRGMSFLGPSLRRMRELEYWFLFPDRRVGWILFAVIRALRTNQRRAIDLVYSSSGVITSHVVAYIVKKILRKPWVADFQDPWAEGAVSSLFPSQLHARMARRLEGLILRNADHITVTADPLRRTFEQRREEILPGKVTVIPMGYDPAAFDDLDDIQRPKFTITHFGSFYAARSPGPFLEALGQCVQEHPQLSEDLEVLFLGTFDPVLRDLAVSMIDRWRLHDIVRLEGAVSYTIGLQLLVSSDVLVLIADPGQWAKSTIPAKLYEYLAAKRPILALLPDGPAAEILRQANAGLIVPPDDVRAIREAIWDLYQRSKDGRLTFHRNSDIIKRYAWTTLAGRLAAVFDGAFSTYTSIVR